VASSRHGISVDEVSAAGASSVPLSDAGPAEMAKLAFMSPARQNKYEKKLVDEKKAAGGVPDHRKMPAPTAASPASPASRYERKVASSRHGISVDEVSAAGASSVPLSDAGPAEMAKLAFMSPARQNKYEKKLVDEKKAAGGVPDHRKMPAPTRMIAPNAPPTEVRESPASVLLPPLHHRAEERAAPKLMIMGQREDGLPKNRSLPVPRSMYAEKFSPPASTVTETLFNSDAGMMIHDPVTKPNEPEDDKALCTLTRRRCSCILTVCAAIVVVVVAYFAGGGEVYGLSTRAGADVRDPTKNLTRNPMRDPTRNPTPVPAKAVTKRPPLRQTGRPTDSTSGPTRDPKKNLTRNPTRDPTRNPTLVPFKAVAKRPTLRQTGRPTDRTSGPTRYPLKNPTRNPTRYPTRNPTPVPTKSSVVPGRSFENLLQLNAAVVDWMETGEFDDEIKNWNTGAVQDMSCLFNGSENPKECDSNEDPFKQKIATWKKYTDYHDTDSLFSGIKRDDARFVYFNADIIGWDVSKVTSFAFLFSHNEIFNKDISQWEVGNVTDMQHTFRYCLSFNADIRGWDVSNVTTLVATFKQTKAFSINLSDWDVGKVNDFKDTFSKTSGYNAGCLDWGGVSGDGSTWEESKGKFCSE